ncbi:MAG: PBSX family phage terminase large subunit [Ruminococcaceae bacterium]|nr:PBSX family phage terminase large subunit [Oscillospiraceae bacterium]
MELLARPVMELDEQDASQGGEDSEMNIARALVKKASAGDLQAIKEIRSLTENLGIQEKQEFQMPAKMLAEPYLSVWRDIKNRMHTEYVLYGGRGSAKSTFISLMIVDLLLSNPTLHAVLCRRVKDTLRDSVYAQMKWAIAELGYEAEFECRVNPMEIIYKPTGQKIYFRGADDPAKLKSIKVPFGYIGILWFEELDQFCGEEEIRSIEQSVIRGGDEAYIFKSFNPPKTAGNWANQYVLLPKENRLVKKTTYLEIPPEWLGRVFLEEAEHLRETNPLAYEHEYEGVANGAGGNVFTNLTVREITDAEINSFDRIYNGIDWGWYPDPFRFHRMAHLASERKLFIFDEVSGNKLPNREIANLLRQKGIGQTDKITADSGGEGLKSIADLREMGFSVRRAKKGPGSVDYSMKWLSSLQEIIIDPKRCPEASKEFMHYEYEMTESGAVVSGYPDRDNHSIDAVRYALEEVWRRRGK